MTARVGMIQRMVPLGRRRDLPLSGGRRRIRSLLVGSLGLLGLIGAAGLLVGRHRVLTKVGWGPWHSLALDGWLLPLLAPLSVVVLAVWAWRRGFRAGVLVAFAMIFAGLVASFTRCDALHRVVESSPGEQIGVNALLVGGGLLAWAAVIVLPLLQLLERRALVAANTRVFATARVVRR
ncbi:MAG TPA: hypothetical protein VM734_09435 [Kofleriaceae bacterium]|nr:hypothetical protein [Kofleriaceae bacterium]